MTSNNRYPAGPVRELRRVPAPSIIPADTSPEIAASIRRQKLEDEQARILLEASGLTPAQARRMKNKARSRYTNSVKRRARISEGEPFARQEIIRRDHRTCYLCHRPNLDDAEIHIDHDIPLSRGGTHTAANVHVACSDCNLRKGNMTSSEYRATLRLRAR